MSLFVQTKQSWEQNISKKVRLSFFLKDWLVQIRFIPEELNMI